MGPAHHTDEVIPPPTLRAQVESLASAKIACNFVILFVVIVMILVAMYLIETYA